MGTRNRLFWPCRGPDGPERWGLVFDWVVWVLSAAPAETDVSRVGNIVYQKIWLNALVRVFNCASNIALKGVVWMEIKTEEDMPIGLDWLRLA